MRLILDTNIIVASLLKDSLTRKLMLSPFFEFYLPEYALEEVDRLLPMISKRSSVPGAELRLLLSILLERIKITAADKIARHIKEARKTIGKIDRNDVPFLALALSLPNDGIWTNDPHFLEQKKIKVWTTPELLKYMRSSAKNN